MEDDLSITAPADEELAPSIEIDNHMHENVNFLLQFNNHSLSARLDNFNINSQTLSSLESLIVILLVCTVVLVWSYYQRFLSSDSILDYLMCSFVTFMVVSSIVIALWTRAVAKAAIRSNGGVLPPRVKQLIQSAQMTMLGCWIAAQGSRLVVRVVSGPCPRYASEEDRWNCNDVAEVGLLPMDSLVILMFMPVYFVVCVRGAHHTFCVIMWMVCMSIMIFSATYSRARNSALFIAAYGVASLGVVMEMRKINLFRFFTHMKLEEMLAEKARVADEANAQEMRSMIANVAHDLKTPLTSFLTGVEFICEVVRDLMALADAMELHQSACAIANSKLHECVSSLDNCATDMRNTNAFMLMTINRCIDYTKTAKGVKLLPKLETVRLLDVLQMPFKCMKDVQRRVGLSLAPLATGICSHVITDGQWLQENILCLLSNAVKYSSEGTVLVRVHKVTRRALALNSGASASSSVSSKESCRVTKQSNQPAAVRLTRSHSASVHFKSRTPSHRVFCIDRDATQLLDGPSDDSRQMLCFEVEDHGIGLSEDAMTNLFNPFKQAQRLAGGTGLGLFSLAKRIEALGGSCGVRRRPDGHEGSIFWFEIPYRPDPQAAELSDGVDTEQSPLGPSPVNSPTAISKDYIGSLQSIPRAAITSPRAALSASPHAEGGLSNVLLDILVVDDAPSILKMTTMILRRHKHTVLTATNGADAVKMVAERLQSTGRGFDVVLMDLQMPVMDGLEATRRLRALDRSAVTLFEAPHLIVIGVSANSDAETAAEAQAAGVDAFIPKPFSLEAFYREYKDVTSFLRDSR